MIVCLSISNFFNYFVFFYFPSMICLDTQWSTARMKKMVAIHSGEKNELAFFFVLRMLTQYRGKLHVRKHKNL